MPCYLVTIPQAFLMSSGRRINARHYSGDQALSTKAEIQGRLAHGLRPVGTAKTGYHVIQLVDFPILDHLPEKSLRLLRGNPNTDGLEPISLLNLLTLPPAYAKLLDDVIDGPRDVLVHAIGRPSSERIHLEHVDERAGRLGRGGIPAVLRISVRLFESG